MLHYVIFALAVVSTCSGENPLVPVLENELSLLTELMTSIESRIETAAKTEVGALTNASITCWALNLASFKDDVQKSFANNLAGYRGDLQDALERSSTMPQDELDELENELVDSSESSLNTRLTNSVEKFIQEASATIRQLNAATKFTCTPGN